MGTVSIILLFVLVILYVVVIPLARKQYQKKQITEMSSFIDNLAVGDQVIMNSGIVGSITKIEAYLFHISISSNTVIRVDKHSILGKFEEK